MNLFESIYYIYETIIDYIYIHIFSERERERLNDTVLTRVMCDMNLYDANCYIHVDLQESLINIDNIRIDFAFSGLDPCRLQGA